MINAGKCAAAVKRQEKNKTISSQDYAEEICSWLQLSAGKYVGSCYEAKKNKTYFAESGPTCISQNLEKKGIGLNALSSGSVFFSTSVGPLPSAVKEKDTFENLGKDLDY